MHAETKASTHPINVQRRLKILLWPFCVCIHVHHSGSVHKHQHCFEGQYSQRSCQCHWCRTRHAGNIPPASGAVDWGSGGSGWTLGPSASGCGTEPSPSTDAGWWPKHSQRYWRTSVLRVWEEMGGWDMRRSKTRGEDQKTKREATKRAAEVWKACEQKIPKLQHVSVHASCSGSIIVQSKCCQHGSEPKTKLNATEKLSKRKRLKSQKLSRSQNLQIHKTNAKEKCSKSENR